jgi:hypothetical protein
VSPCDRKASLRLIGLFVYNRVAQSNELLITQGRLTFTRNLGDWRNTYCDTNGYVQAYLLCASDGVARVTHGYETYPGQPFFISCSSVLVLKAWTINIYPKGQVAFTGASTNILYSLEPGSWTNCIWTISSTTDMLADDLTSAPVYSFYVGTNVWVNPGIVATNYTITCSAVGLPGLDAKAGLVVSREIAWTPKGNSVYVWEPINDDNFSSAFIQDLCMLEAYQGWSYSTTNPVTWFFDSDPTDDNCETCTLLNLKAMVNGGIIAVLTHGETGVLEVVRFASESVANTWKGSEPNMYVIASSNSASVYATSAWFQNNWKNSLTQNNAIVFISACHAADGDDSIASSVGGQTVFAPHGSPSGQEVDEDYKMIISLMNGTSFPRKSYQRVAANAYALTTEPVKHLISYVGDGLSTLCPAPQNVFPFSSAEVKTGWGCILFDSYMNGSVSAGTAVIQKTGTVGTRSWGSNLSGSFFIDFLYSGTSASVEALGDKCRSAGNVQGQPLDGDGIAPMSADGQSKEWSW